ncbi:GNAT family N-acetyltransferase [Nocardioides sp. zg-579]|uniref:GNAT family N-acetyltransferase n=1 Tax=Nocardioides marmotae TaxID=2663857 RepID=A0A6I3JD70_9ACTN|nr:N-acetyltransferase [Nocardioides marmotae]MCR6032419.1 GNAT family N-acetyltransferase [Gordonia jinghuaiqii]MTB96068.1 GNAT family N-acetyltransferase [Nocardioides marmotae]QKE02612.1 GNAT family N-acetyltransferase [Nocardioides marmotae]
MSVRAAGPEDLDAVAALEEECLGADAWSRGLIAAGLAGEVPTVVYLVAEAEAEVEAGGAGGAGGVVGHAVASIVADVAELQRIAVTPAARRGGHATDLLEEVVARSRAGGAERLLLEVREDNAGALAFYAARGFVEVDRRRRYYRDGATAVVLRLPLRKGC